MTNQTSSKFDDDDINDDDLLAACDDVITKNTELILPTGTLTKEFCLMKIFFSLSRNHIIRFSI
jgi:hypothetical protein